MQSVYDIYDLMNIMKCIICAYYIMTLHLINMKLAFNIENNNLKYDLVPSYFKIFFFNVI